MYICGELTGNVTAGVGCLLGEIKVAAVKGLRLTKLEVVYSTKGWIDNLVEPWM